MLDIIRISLASYRKASRQAKSASVTPRSATSAAKPLLGYYYQSPGIIKISQNTLGYETGVE